VSYKKCKDVEVSIILPVYNGEKYLECSIKSCLNQTFENWELLIIDDNSCDRSAEIAIKYEAQDRRIRYYKNDVNKKLPATLNKGFSLARGKYLTWTSDDNYYRNDALEKMLKALEVGKAEFVFTAQSVVNEKDELIEEQRIFENPKHLIWRYNIVGACFLYSRKVYETIGDYDTTLFLGEDYDYWLRVFRVFKAVYLDENLYVYRKHEGALTATHRIGQHEALEKVLLKNLTDSKEMTNLDWLYVYRGLHRSRRMRKSLMEKFEYLPKWCYYKILDILLYKKQKDNFEEWKVEL